MRKEWLETDYYAVLGVDKTATAKDIKKAFRSLAQKYHPDRNPGDETSELKFKEINEAYEVIGDEETRTEYDKAREMGYFVGGPGGGQQYVRVEDLFGGQGYSSGGSPFDLFGDLLGGGGVRSRRQVQPQQGRDVSASLGLTFHEAISGVTKTVSVNGSQVKVKIPQGIADGKRVRVKGHGEPGFNGGPNGDLLVTVKVAEHPIFGRRGPHLTIEVPITFAEATLGAEIDVPTLDAPVRLRIPPGTPNGKTFRVPGRGVVSNDKTGDLLVTVALDVPKDLTEEQRTLLEKFRDNGPQQNPRAHLGV